MVVYDKAYKKISVITYKSKYKPLSLISLYLRSHSVIPTCDANSAMVCKQKTNKQTNSTHNNNYKKSIGSK